MEWIAALSDCTEKYARALNACMSAYVGKAKPLVAPQQTHSTPEYHLCFPAHWDALSVFTTELLSRCWDTSQALCAKYRKTHAQEKVAQDRTLGDANFTQTQIKPAG